MKTNRIRGFTLVELLVVVAIAGILSAIAIPSYQQYVIRSARTSAQTELLQLANLQEKIFLNASAYTPNITGTYNAQTAADNVAATGGLGRASGTTSDGKYNLTLDITAPSQTYVLSAKPVATKAQAGNGCLTIQENGKRTWYQNDDTCVTSATPW
jgi:type IV pilus assembly protein PilE